jgi:hypothetical protein
MSAGHWVAYILVALLALAGVLYLYRKREPAGRGRTALALLRWGSLALLFLLLFDPRFRQPADRAAVRRAPVLLDASLSMLMPGSDGSARWKNAVADASGRAGTGGITLFGDVIRAIPHDSVSAALPSATHSRLLPALEAAAEGGATAITVITDGDIEDADAVARWLPRLGVHVDWITHAADVADVALTEMSAPAWGESGKALDVEIGLQSNGVSTGARDSATITLRQDNTVLAVQRVAMPAPGRTATARIPVSPRAPTDGGYVRIEATVDAGDRFSDDDVRNVYVYVSAEPAGIVLVSFAPDWEPRFLLPVLERAVALPARGYLRAGNASWVRVGAGLDAGRRVADADVQKAVANADLVVIHNASRDVPPWIAAALTDAQRLIVLPAADANGLAIPVRLGAAVTDDWFLSPEIPPSPVSALLTGLAPADVPPLESVTTAEMPAGAWSPLVVTRGRRGMPAPLAIAGEENSRRWAVALGAGYWHWAFQGGPAADAYNRLWSSLGGWLMRDARSADIAPVRPVDRVVLRGEPVRWVTRAGTLDSVRVTLARTTPAGADTATTTVMVAAAHDTASLNDVAPGTYRFNATAFSADASVSASGELTVETYSPEFARGRANLASTKAAARNLRSIGRDSTPLHASWIPYVMLFLLLAAEWILRRRWGLR